MASEQIFRRDEKTKETESHVEKERVPQLTSHFESLASHGHAHAAGKLSEPSSIAKTTPPQRYQETEKGAGGADAEKVKEETHELAAHFESLADRVRDQREAGHVVGDEKPEDTETFADKVKKKAGKKTEGREHVENREMPQSQAGEERVLLFQKGSQGKEGEMGGREKHEEEEEEEREKPSELGQKEKQPSLEEISEYRAAAQKNSNETIMAAMKRYEEAKDTLSKKVGTATDYAKERGGEARETIKEKSVAEKDVAQEKGQKSLEVAKGTITSAAKTAKDYTVPIAVKAKDYTVQKAVEAKDMTVSAGQTTAHYVGEKVVGAKDVAVESGKTAAEYAGKLAEDLKDKAIIAGWSTAHYSCEKTVEGTKLAARAVKGAAGYAGEIAAKPLSAAKDAAASTGETAKYYTSRKKEEAQRELESKKGGAETEECLHQTSEGTREKTKQAFEGAEEKVHGHGGDQNRVQGETKDGGVLEAIGETIYEIAQTTKNIVIGSGGDTEKQSTLGFDFERCEEGEPTDQYYEMQKHHEGHKETNRDFKK